MARKFKIGPTVEAPIGVTLHESDGRVYVKVDGEMVMAFQEETVSVYTQDLATRTDRPVQLYQAAAGRMEKSVLIVRP